MGLSALPETVVLRYDYTTSFVSALITAVAAATAQRVTVPESCATWTEWCEAVGGAVAERGGTRRNAAEQ